MKEGEGALTQEGDKRIKEDFALWKASKPSEPQWPSPWGPGRPGWHIECSTMANSIFGEDIDLHCGGIDLRFPHHDNEIAQAEAYAQKHQWVRYWLHSGHLHINGRKMSKSEKNFITIKESLLKYTAREIRWLYLLHKWETTMNYVQDSMAEARKYDQKFGEFFVNLKTVLRDNPLKDQIQKFTPDDFVY